MSADFKGLAAELLQASERHVSNWLSAGKRQGKEWVVGSLSNEPGTSLSINLNNGRWADFASGETGGDLIDLYAAIHGISMLEAYKELGGELNPRAPRPMKPRTPAPAPEPTRRVVSPVPESVALHDCAHPKFGRPVRVWQYMNEHGELLGYVARYEPAGERKQIVPWTYDGERWGMGQWPEPRPMYGLQRLAERPDAPVLLVAGEKAADAAHALAGKVYVAMTWPGGEMAWQKTDFSSIYGRKVLIWPDADATGAKCSAAIGAHLFEHCPEVKILDVADQADGWDAADCTMTWAEFRAWARPRAAVIAPPARQKSPTLHPHVNAGSDVAPQSATASPNNSASAGPVHSFPREAGADQTPGPGASGGEVAEIDRTEIVNRFEAVARYGLDASEKGPFTSVANIVRVLCGDPQIARTIWFDEFLGRVCTIWRSDKVREWADVDDIDMQIYLQESLGMPRLGKQTVIDAVQAVAYKDRRNEARAYIEGLQWDGVERLSGFMPECFGTEDTAYTRAVGRNFWTSMVARVMRPGCKVDTMIVLEGVQGAGKSQALAIIGGQWFAEANQSPSDKDFYMNLSGKMLVEIGEMDAFNRSEVTKVKQVITCQTDRFRAPYDRRSADHPRRNVFAGTTNRDDWNKDETGARRFWPVYCTEIDHARITRDRDQFFAEAAHRLAAGGTWWEMPAEETRAQQEARRDSDELEDVMADWLRFKSETTVTAVMEDFMKLPLDKQDKQMQMRISKVLRVIGWRRLDHKVSRGGRMVRVWKRGSGDGEGAFEGEPEPF